MTVVCEPNIKSGRPIVEGSKISVLQIYEMFEDGISPERIEMEFENISVEDVTSALEYVEKNLEKMEKIQERKSEAEEELTEIGEVYERKEGDEDDEIHKRGQPC